MITADRSCDSCTKRRLCRCTGMRWLCRDCWQTLTDFPWEVKESA